MRPLLPFLFCMAFLLPQGASAYKSVIHHFDLRIEINSATDIDIYEEAYITYYSFARLEDDLVVTHIDKFNELKFFQAEIINSAGEVIKTIRERDLVENSLSWEGNIVDDQILSLPLSGSVMPVSIRYEMKIRQSASLFLPAFRPVKFTDQLVEKASFTVQAPLDFALSFKTQKLNEPHIERTEGTISYQYQMDSFPAVTEEPYMPALLRLTPWAEVSALQFEIEKTRGSFASWAEFGNWSAAMLYGTDDIGYDSKAALDRITDTVSDTLQRIQQVFRWVQNRTRYISIQQGLGGWKPMPASEVDEYGYGDCKALVNYTRSALQHLGIKAHYCLVNYGKGRDPVDPDFPNQAFNHVILSVPMKTDTIWLECTNQQIPLNYLGYGVENRKALIVEKNQSQLVTTPSTSSGYHKVSRKIQMEVQSDGSALITSESYHSGLDFYWAWESVEPDTRKRAITENVDFTSFELDTFHIANCEEKAFTNRIYTAGYVPRFAQKVAGYLSVKPRFFKYDFPELPHADNRIHQLHFRKGYRILDTITINLPEGYTASDLPTSTSAESDFGSYSSDFTIHEGQLKCVLQAVLKPGMYDANRYAEIRLFLNTVKSLPEQRVLLQKQS